MFVSPHSTFIFIYWNSTPHCDGVWRNGLWEVIMDMRPWGCGSHDEISDFFRRDTRQLVPFFLCVHASRKGHVSTWQENSHLQARKKSSHQNLSMLASYLELAVSRTVRVKCLLLKHPAYFNGSLSRLRHVPLVSFLFVAALWGSSDVKQLPLIVLDKCPEGRLFAVNDLWDRPKKGSPGSGGFQETRQVRW